MDERVRYMSRLRAHVQLLPQTPTRAPRYASYWSLKRLRSLSLQQLLFNFCAKKKNRSLDNNNMQFF